MNSSAELEPLLRVPQLHPSHVRKQAAWLRKRSRQCSDLADTSLTTDARQVFDSLAQELGREADQLEDALAAIRRIYGEDAGPELEAAGN